MTRRVAEQCSTLSNESRTLYSNRETAPSPGPSGAQRHRPRGSGPVRSVTGPGSSEPPGTRDPFPDSSDGPPC
eukprot:767916-Hanusia_phi.AAC.7